MAPKSFKKYLNSVKRSPFYFLVINDEKTDDKISKDKKLKKEIKNDDFTKSAELRYIQNASARN